MVRGCSPLRELSRGGSCCPSHGGGRSSVVAVMVEALGAKRKGKGGRGELRQGPFYRPVRRGSGGTGSSPLMVTLGSLRLADCQRGSRGTAPAR